MANISDSQREDDLWIAQSLGDASNWKNLSEDERNILRRKQAWYTIVAIILALGIGVLSVIILCKGAKVTLATSALTIIGAVFPAMEKVVSGSLEYFKSKKTKEFMPPNLNLCVAISIFMP